MNNTPNISIIIPIYNVGEYLRECIDSILNQTYSDFELLLIDDGSKDQSGEICDEYASKDSRIRVFHKENGGVSSARNLGLDNVRGVWVTFVDADDKLGENYLDNLARQIDIGIDLVVGGFREFGDFHEKKIFYNKQVFDFSHSKDYLDIDPCRNKGISVFYYPWGKLYRNSLFTTHRFRFNTKMKLAEDSTFLIAFASQAGKGVLAPFADYEYRRCEGNEGKYSMNYREFCSHMEEFDKVVEMFSKARGYDLSITRNVIYKNFFYNFFRWLKQQNRQEFIRYCELFVKDYGFKWLLEFGSGRSLLFKCYLILIFHIPYIGFYIKK